MKTKKKTKKTSRFRPAFILALVAVTGVAGFQVACGDDDNAVKETLDSGNQTPTDSSLTDTNQGDATLTDAGCFLSPMTHFQIINACTDATRIDKNPVLTKLLPDGSLPPLQ